MSNILKGNKAVKIPSENLSRQEADGIFSREGYIYLNMLQICQTQIEDLSFSKNIDILEYNALFNQRCGRYEKLFYHALRTKMREKLYNDQIKEFNGNYQGIYHPYNPYLQKYNGEYLRSYQLFD